jgi:hypothetical protein
MFGRDTIYENAGMAALSGRGGGGKPLERYEFGRQKPLKSTTELQVSLLRFDQCSFKSPKPRKVAHEFYSSSTGTRKNKVNTRGIFI